MKATIYHNPRCSKSTQTLALLEENGVDVTIIEYLKTPPDEKTLNDIVKKLGLDAADLLRKKEAPFKELSLGDKLEQTDTVINAMITHPILIERPIVLANGKAAIGRPPENVLAIL